MFVLSKHVHLIHITSTYSTQKFPPKKGMRDSDGVLSTLSTLPHRFNPNSKKKDSLAMAVSTTLSQVCKDVISQVSLPTKTFNISKHISYVPRAFQSWKHSFQEQGVNILTKVICLISSPLLGHNKGIKVLFFH